MKILLVVAAGLSLTAWIVWSVTMKMPLTSDTAFQEPLLPGERALRPDLRLHVEKLGGEIGERNLVHPAALSAAARYLETTLTGYGYKVQTSEARTPAGSGLSSNLVVELRGATRPEEIVVIGAHYDTAPGAPGADDNATGCAAVLVLAHAFAGKAQDRTLRFALFTNEEPPNTNADMGSLVYARQCRAHGDNVVAMMSLETIGYYSDNSGSQKYPFPVNLMYPPVGNFLGFVGNIGSRGLVRQAIGVFRQSRNVPSIGLSAPAFIKGVDWSDHASFWEAGYPAIMITDTALFRNPHYHKASDTPDKIDYDRLARVTNGLQEVTANLVRSKGAGND